MITGDDIPSGIRNNTQRVGFVRIPYFSRFSSMSRAFVARRTSVIRFRMPAHP